MCLANFRSVSFFVWSEGGTQTYRHTYIYMREYPNRPTAACSPPVDFENEVILTINGVIYIHINISRSVHNSEKKIPF